MSGETAPERIAVIWSPETRADLRAIERGTAMQILRCVDRYLASRTGVPNRAGGLPLNPGTGDGRGPTGQM